MSVEERLHEAMALLTLIHVAASADPEHTEAEEHDKLDAIARVSAQARRLLDPIRQAPAEALNWRPGQ